MRTTKQLSVTLPTAMADELKDRVASGEYASESEVIRDGLRALFARERAVDAWLETEAAAAYDELKGDPAQALSVSQVRENLARRHTIRTGGSAG